MEEGFVLMSVWKQEVSFTCYTTHLKWYLPQANLPMALPGSDRGDSVGWLWQAVKNKDDIVKKKKKWWT